MKNVLFILCLFCFYLCTAFTECLGAYPPLIRAHAFADVMRLEKGQYFVSIFLEIHNDDNRIPLIIESVTADSWRGTRKATVGENWFESPQPIVLMQNAKQKIVSRSFYVNKGFSANYWVRWLKFKIKTNRGVFESNYVSSPYSANISGK